MPDGGKSRKGDLAWEVCTNHHMAEVENLWLGPEGFSFSSVVGVENFVLCPKAVYLSVT